MRTAGRILSVLVAAGAVLTLAAAADAQDRRNRGDRNVRGDSVVDVQRDGWRNRGDRDVRRDDRRVTEHDRRGDDRTRGRDRRDDRRVDRDRRDDRTRGRDDRGDWRGRDRGRDHGDWRNRSHDRRGDWRRDHRNVRVTTRHHDRSRYRRPHDNYYFGYTNHGLSFGYSNHSRWRPYYRSYRPHYRRYWNARYHYRRPACWRVTERSWWGGRPAFVSFQTCRSPYGHTYRVYDSAYFVGWIYGGYGYNTHSRW